MPLVGECFQYVREPTNEEDAISVACNNFHSKEEVVDLVQPKSPWLILFLLHYTLDISATGKRVNHGGEYGLEIPANFHFY